MKIESFFPGRLRVRSSLFTNEKTVEEIRDHVLAMNGVTEITVNSRTGSLTLLYNPSLITNDMLMQAKEELERRERGEA